MTTQLEQPGGEEQEQPKEQQEEQELSPELQQRAAADPKFAGILNDLKSERKERGALSTKVKELEARASEADTLKGQLAALNARMQQLEPDLEIVKRLPPEIVEAVRRGKPQEPDISDDEAADAARSYGLFNLQGEPDLKAGRKIRGDMRRMIAEEATKIADARIAPVMRSTQEHQANYLVGLARQKAAEGYCKPDIFEQVLAGVPVDQRANENAMNAALVMARGIGGPGTVVEQREPLYSESSGGRRGLAPGPLSTLEQRAARDAGITEQQWKDSTKNYIPGQAVRLE